MSSSRVQFVPSKVTGGHYAFLPEKAKTPFTNKLTEARTITLGPEDVVADIGAYVGEYGLYAIRNGAGRVKCYEPTPVTFDLLCINVGDTIETYNLAVVGDDSTTVRLNISSGIGVTNSIAKSARKVGYIEVPAIRYEDAVRDATVVKIDVEGAEYSYNILQPHLRAFILEFHPMTGFDWKAKAEQIMTDIEAAGYVSTCRPTWRNGFDCHGAWVRPT